MDIADMTIVEDGAAQIMRAAAVAHWDGVWAEAGIAMDHRAVAGAPGGACKPGDLAHVLRGLDAGRLSIDDLVSIRDGALPDAGNQHFRRVVRIDPSHGAHGAVDVTLGRSMPRIALPPALRAATVPTEIRVDVDAGIVTLTDASGFSIGLPAGPGPADVTAGYVTAMIAGVAEAGRSDDHGSVGRSFSVRAASHEGERTWDLVDSGGTVHARDSRAMLDRQPTKFIDALAALARVAYAEVRSECPDPDPDAIRYHSIDLDEGMAPAPGP